MNLDIEETHENVRHCWNRGPGSVMLEDILGDPPEDPLQRAASHVDEAMSILVGIAANLSMRSGQPVKVGDLVRF